MKKILLALLFLLLIFIFPQSVGAGDLGIVRVFYYEIEYCGESLLSYYQITVPAWFCVEVRAIIVFNEIFDNFNPDKMVFVPPGVRILGVAFDDVRGHLTLNLSDDILNYGGTYFEDRLVSKLLANAAGLEGVRYLTVLIEGQQRYFPEGSMIIDVRVGMEPHPYVGCGFHPAPLSQIGISPYKL